MRVNKAKGENSKNGHYEEWAAKLVIGSRGSKVQSLIRKLRINEKI